MLKLYHSNRIEELFDRLLTVRGQALLAPMVQETIVVQSQGMSRWLALALAFHESICANMDFAFPAAFIWRLFNACDNRGGRETSPYERDSLVWAIMGQLAALPAAPVFEPLRSYLVGDDTPVRRYQLALRLASVFDQYLVYRPDWIQAWELGEEQHWQATLWRLLAARHGDHHRASHYLTLGRSLDADLVRRASVPPDIYLFGIPTMPMAYLEIFQRLAEIVNVHFFLLNPCQIFWDDIVSNRELSALSLKSALRPEEDLHYETGNPLLTSFGRQGRDFQRLIHSYDGEEELCFVDPADGRLLSEIQADILHGRQRQESEKLPLPRAADRSIMIQAVHSPMREIEVLHDQLLDLMAADPSLSPGDILVMTPDIAQYGPYIEAVFSTSEEGTRIPFSIADQRPAEESLTIKAFFNLLRLASGRLGASQVLALLETEPIRASFGLTVDDISLIRRWVRETAIHWGADRAHVQQLGLPPEASATWEHGLDRLFLGYALPGGNRRFFADILPYDHVEGDSARGLGRFAAFYQALLDFSRQGGEKSLPAWRTLLLQVLERFFVDGNGQEPESGLLCQALDQMIRNSEIAGFGEPVSLEVVMAHLEGYFSEPGRGSSFLAGRVTFCQMVPMRAIPSRVICLLGMNDGSFPRQDRSPGFDLMAGDFRPGDRSRRDDDRYLFLEALLSARDHFYLSYIGRSSRDNALTPPSPALSELLDYIEGIVAAEPGAIREQLLTFHPLQLFSARYFQNSGPLFTYSEVNARIARARQENKSDGGIFAAGGLEPEPGKSELSLDEFVEFFMNPVQYLLRRRLNIMLSDRQDEISDREKFSLDRLEGYNCSRELVEAELNGEAALDLLPVYRAAGFPQGESGRLDFQELAASANMFASRIKEVRGDGTPRQVEIDLELEAVRLRGRVQLWPGGQSLYRQIKMERLNYRDTVQHWLNHLLLCAAAEVGEEVQTTFIATDGILVYERIPDAMELLQELGIWYRRGCSLPLPLFPRTSYAYAVKLWQGISEPVPEAAFAKAAGIWHHGDFLRPAEKTDPWFRAAFGERDPTQDEDFHAAAAVLLERAVRERQVIDET